MQEGWGVDSLYYLPHDIAFPFCCYDDGECISESERDARFKNRVDLMYDNDTTSYGEKPVSHIKVISNRLYTPGQTRPYNGRPTNATYTTWGYSQWHWTHHVESFMNGFHERVYKHWGDTPQETDCWYDVTYTRVMKVGIYLSYYDGVAYGSDSYCKEYGRTPGATWDPGSCQLYVEEERKDDTMYQPLRMTPELAQRYYDTVAPKHATPHGIWSELFREAMNSFSFNTNSIANCVDMIGLIKDIKSGRIFSDLSEFATSSLAKKASSMWMGYRYSYTTTKSDIEEYTSKLSTVANYGASGTHVARSGYSDESGSYHCKVVYQDKRQNDVCELYKQLKRAGLALDAYNIWDMVPMSFVIDWFLPIGDWLEDWSSNWVSTPGYFTFSSITTSSKWNEVLKYPDGTVEVSAYSRAVSTKPPQFESFSEDPSTGTVIKRFIDGVCMLIG